MLYRPILLMSMGARNMMGYAHQLEKGIQLVIFTPPSQIARLGFFDQTISLQDFENLGIFGRHQICA
jgi:hypothetical protein